MRILELSELTDRPIPQFDSVGFTVGSLGALEVGHVTAVQLEPGGRIGRHPAVGGQLLVVLAGAATVAGGQGADVEVRPGQAVWWDAGEQHETTSVDGVMALIVEGAWKRAPAE